MTVSALDWVQRHWLGLSAFTLSAITIVSLYPLTSLPSLPGSDKTHHVAAYFALMLPTALRRPKYWLGIAAFFVLWSGMIELIQPYVNRYGEWLDLAANTAGIVCACLVAQIIRFATAAQK